MIFTKKVKLPHKEEKDDSITLMNLALRLVGNTAFQQHERRRAYVMEMSGKSEGTQAKEHGFEICQ